MFMFVVPAAICTEKKNLAFYIMMMSGKEKK